MSEANERLRDTLRLAATAGMIGSPVSHARLLEMIVETGANVIGARAGALFLLDEENDDLTFEVAIGSRAAEVKRFRVPLGHGIAGIVAASGQAMAIRDAAGDPRLASDIADSVGYVPETVLCVPLFYGDNVIGALELLDKESGFSAGDMEALGLFANQAAVRAPALPHVRERRGPAWPMPSAEGADDISRDAVELARLVQEITRYGETERKACRDVLVAFAEYLRARSSPME